MRTLNPSLSTVRAGHGSHYQPGLEEPMSSFYVTRCLQNKCFCHICRTFLVLVPQAYCPSFTVCSSWSCATVCRSSPLLLDLCLSGIFQSLRAPRQVATRTCDVRWCQDGYVSPVCSAQLHLSVCAEESACHLPSLLTGAVCHLLVHLDVCTVIEKLCHFREFL